MAAELLKWKMGWEEAEPGERGCPHQGEKDQDRASAPSALILVVPRAFSYPVEQKLFPSWM